MDQITIGLVQMDGEEIELTLTEDNRNQKVSNDWVFANKRYSILLEKTGMDIHRVEVNGEAVEFTVEQRRIFFVHSKIFFDQVGYAQLSITVGQKVFYSAYLPILIKEGEFIQSVPHMIRYIEANFDKLTPPVADEAVFELTDQEISGLEKRLQLTEKILQIFEKRARLSLANHRDITSSDYNSPVKPVSHVNRNPFRPGYPYSLKTTSGLKTGESSEKKLTGFEVEYLQSFLLEVHRIQKRLMISSSMAVTNRRIPEDYLFSPEFLYLSLKHTLDPLIETWHGIERKTRRLILSFDKKGSSRNPGLMGLQSYLSLKGSKLPPEIEHLSRSWISLRVPMHEYTLEQNFSKISGMYEKYLLIRFLDLLENNGYRLKTSSVHFYPGQPEENPEFDNVYKLENEQGELVLYYQPFIYDQFLLNGKTGLYRNNSTLDWGSGQYYTPDFVMKFNRNGNNYYVILDAKFSSLSTIRKEKIQHLIFKYINSISPIKTGDRILGLEILYGKFSGYPPIESFYNRQFREIFPFIEFFPLAQGINDDLHDKSFKEFLGKIERAIENNQSN